MAKETRETREIISGIYKIENKVNGKIYIGSSIDINKRWRYHVSDFEANRHCNSYFQNAWNKYGKDSFEFSIIEILDIKDNIFEREQYWLDILKPFGNIGYNLCPTTNSYSFGYSLKGSTIDKLKNRKFTEEHKRNMSINSPKKKSIIQMNLNGELIKIWESSTEACKSLNINTKSLWGCLERIDKRLSVKNFIWIYYEEYISESSQEIINEIVNKIKNRKQNGNRSVIQMTLDNEFIKQWDTATEAGKVLSINRVGIMNCCRGNQNVFFNYKWVYEDDYNNGIIDNFKSKPRLHNSIVQLGMDYNFIKHWDGTKQIQEELNYKSDLIYDCCRQTKSKSSYGYRWLYQKDYEYGNYIQY